jgi:hypothetical protein
MRVASAAFLSGLALAAPVLLASSLASPSVHAASRGDSASERKRTAVEMCARELRQRQNARDVRVDRTIRNDYGKDQVSWSGYMTAQRNGPDGSYKVDCVVDFKGSNRITRFDVRGNSDWGSGWNGGGWGGGSGSGSDQASRACWREAERRSFDVNGIDDSRDVGGWGRLVMLRVDGRRQLMCLYRGSPTLYRPL